jgi:hypothetical protein
MSKYEADTIISVTAFISSSLEYIELADKWKCR